MKKLISIFAFFFLFSQAQAANQYKLDPNHTNVFWSASHFGFSNPSGKFSDVEGVINLDESDPQSTAISVSIKTASVVTGIPAFDKHLQGGDFFNSDKFPTAQFISTKVLKGAQNNVTIVGDLNFLGVVKTIIFNAKVNKIALNPMTQRKTIGFSATATIKRSDFGMLFGLPGISDNVKLNIEAEAILDDGKTSTNPDETAKMEAKPTSPAWNIIAQNSSINFKAKQGTSEIEGYFKKFGGKINFDKTKQSGNKVVIEVDTTSINTSFTNILETLKTTAWLASNTFPKAIFTATDFITISDKPTDNNMRYVVSAAVHSQEFAAKGHLSIKGKSVPATARFHLEEHSKNEVTAIGSFTIKRSDFNLGTSDTTVSKDLQDEVVINFRIMAQR